MGFPDVLPQQECQRVFPGELEKPKRLVGRKAAFLQLGGECCGKDFVEKRLGLRIGPALAWVGLAYVAPSLALVILVVAMVASLSVISATWFLRRGFQWRSRVQCPGCDYRPLRIARICPQCRRPVLLVAAADLGKTRKLEVLTTAIAMAWADGVLDDHERVYLLQVIDGGDFSADEVEHLRRMLDAGCDAGDLRPEDLSSGEREALLTVAARVAACNGDITPGEAGLYRNLTLRLGVGEPRAAKHLRRAMAMATD